MARTRAPELVGRGWVGGRPTSRRASRGAVIRAAEVLNPAQRSLNPAQIAAQIADLQATLLRLAKDKTEQLYLASFPTALPDVRKGIRIKAS